MVEKIVRYKSAAEVIKPAILQGQYEAAKGANRIQKLSGGRGSYPDEGAAQPAFGSDSADPGGEDYYGSAAQPAFGLDGADPGGEDYYGSATQPAFGSDSAGPGGEDYYGSAVQPGFSAAAGPSPEYTDKVSNAPVLGVAGLKAAAPESEHSEEEEDDDKGRGILIALIVILILLILLVGFSAFAYIQGLIDF